jgi:hypothetical protein
MMKSLEKSGLAKTGVIIIASLIRWKSIFPSLSHLKRTSFFNKRLSGFAILTKFGMNLLMKLIWPKKDCRAFLYLWRGIFLMASILEGSIEIPYFEMIWPNNMPLSTLKIDFLGLREMPYYLHLSKIILKCWIC